MSLQTKSLSRNEPRAKHRDETLKNHGSYVFGSLVQKLREEEEKYPAAVDTLKSQVERQQTLHRLRSHKILDENDQVATHITYTMGSLMDKVHSRFSPVQLDELAHTLRREETVRLNTMKTLGTNQYETSHSSMSRSTDRRGSFNFESLAAPKSSL